MVKHQPLQVYERQPCLSFVTGVYGCRWKRYQRCHDDSSAWECVWFLVLCSSFLLLLFWSYFWLEAHNDYNEFNWLLYQRSGRWRDGTVPILTSTAVGLGYVSLLTILALFHISLGQQLNLYWVHKVGVLAALLTTISGFISIEDVWGSEWDIVLISLQSTGPFLHIGGLAAVTALGWLVSGHLVRTDRSRLQAAVLLVYLGVLLALYLAPLALSAPCVMERSGLRPRPDVIGRRGAPMLAPENTLMSFNKALQQGVTSLEADVTVSLDGVPFLMRDRTLGRTTDVRRLFPLRQSEDASLFNWTEIRSLNAGRWFLESDPYWSAGSLSARERSRAGRQGVCSLVELLRLAVRANSSAVLRLRRPPPGHPRSQTWLSDSLGAVQSSGISQGKVTWTGSVRGEEGEEGEEGGLQRAAGEKLPVEELRSRGIHRLNLHYSQASRQELQAYRASNVSVTVYPVNEPWLYSVLWCSGVSSVSSDAPQRLRRVPYPLWVMSPGEYSLVWITSDLVSVAIVIGIFIFQKWRLSRGRSYSPEQIMLSSMVRPSRSVDVMKEKLIFSDINSGVDSAEQLSLYPDNGYASYSEGGVAY